MDDRSLFLSVFAILIIFNIAYLLSRPPLEQATLVTQMAFGGIIGLIVTVGGIAIASGATIMGSGLNSESIKLIFGIGTILNILFQISFGPLSIGIGLVNPIFAVFLVTGSGFLMFLGFMVATVLALAALISGLMMIQG